MFASCMFVRRLVLRVHCDVLKRFASTMCKGSATNHTRTRVPQCHSRACTTQGWLAHARIGLACISCSFFNSTICGFGTRCRQFILSAWLFYFGIQLWVHVILHLTGRNVPKGTAEWVGLARPVCIHRIIPDIWALPFNKQRIYIIYIYVWFWPTLKMRDEDSKQAHPFLAHSSLSFSLVLFPRMQIHSHWFSPFRKPVSIKLHPHL
jgi:hypothetical protein